MTICAAYRAGSSNGCGEKATSKRLVHVHGIGGGVACVARIRFEHREHGLADPGDGLGRKALEDLSDRATHVVVEAERFDHLDESIALGVHPFDALTDVGVGQRRVGGGDQGVTRWHRTVVIPRCKRLVNRPGRWPSDPCTVSDGAGHGVTSWSCGS